MIKSVVGEKVVVKPFNDKWITNEYLSWLKDDCVNEYLKSGCKTTTIEEVAAYVNSIQEKKNDFLFAIIGMNGTHVGNIRLTCVDSTARVAQLGMLIGNRNFRGKGVGTEAVRLVLQIAYKQLFLRKVFLEVVADNKPAIRIYEKNDFVVEGILKDHFFKNTRYYDLVIKSVFFTKTSGGGSSVGNNENKNTIRDLYDKRWDSYVDEYKELVKKIENRDYIVRNETVINQIHRSVIAVDYIKENCEKGSRIIDAACGRGFLACYLKQLGHDINGFDFSSVAITRARELGKKLELNPDFFENKDHTYLDTVPDESVDVVLAMGFLRYLGDDVRDYIYRNVSRVLRKGGRFILTNANRLFAVYALNEETLKFWSEVINSFSDAAKLIAPASIENALKSKVKVPIRQYPENSVSKHVPTHEENPLAYDKVVSKYGFVCEKTFYPDAHLLPPIIDQAVDKEALDTMKARVCLSKAEDWQAMFMCYEFLSILIKE